MTTYDWAAYKRHERAHHKGQHEGCSYVKCADRRMIEDANEYHLMVLALFDELAVRHIEPSVYFGDKLDQAQALADADFPEWCDTEPDAIHRLFVRCNFDDMALLLSFAPSAS